MTTAPNSEPASAVAEPATGELAHSDLVTKLVAEAFSGFRRGARPGVAPAVPSEIPVVSDLPGVSAADAGSAAPPSIRAPSRWRQNCPNRKRPHRAATRRIPATAMPSASPAAMGPTVRKATSRTPKRRTEIRCLGFSDAESLGTPEYYFLRGSGVSGKSPRACQSYPKTPRRSRSLTSKASAAIFPRCTSWSTASRSSGSTTPPRPTSRRR